MHRFLIDWWYFDVFQNLISTVLRVFIFFKLIKSCFIKVIFQRKLQYYKEKSQIFRRKII